MPNIPAQVYLRKPEALENIDAFVWKQVILTLLVQAVFPVGFTVSLYMDNPLLLLWCVFVLFPVLDLILPKDNWNPTEA